jgi:Bacterial TSP3 repeat
MVETTVPAATGNQTPVTLSQNDRPILFVRARLNPIPIYTQPITQEVFNGDTVTFSVVAGGDDLSYQWTFNGTNIYGATGSSYTIDNANSYNAGDYACIITSAAGSATTQTASLIVDFAAHPQANMALYGQRQNYTFKSGMNYYIGSTVQLYGNTTFEGGTTIKFDYNGMYPTLQVAGTVTCKGTAYNPTILTTIDDNSVGQPWSQTAPQPVVTGVPFLDLSWADDTTISNMCFRFADEGLSTPAGGRLDVRDCQFFQCDAAIINEFGGRNGLHNALFSGCFDAVAAATNNFSITAEQVTADVSNFVAAAVSPYFAGLTNSIILGNVGLTGSYASQNVAVNPDASNFQHVGSGKYYLAASSLLRQSGTTNVSPDLLAEFRAKTTTPPLAFPTMMTLNGSLMLLPQVPRYTNGALDIGYYYDAMDYTMADLTNSGSITVEPGTVIGFRMDMTTNSMFGIHLREYSSFVSHGTPDRPVTFAAEQCVQEQFEYPCEACFVPDFQGGTNDPGPVLDFRFCDFYCSPGWFHFWSGQGNGGYMASYDSVMNWTMRDCQLHAGQVCVGEPDYGGVNGLGGFFGIPYTVYYGAGAIDWENNLFEEVDVNLQPSYNWYDGTINVDLEFTARNNLFFKVGMFDLNPSLSSVGNWQFTDNLFDRVEIYQDAALPLDFDYNGYAPLNSQLYSDTVTQLQPTQTGDGTTNGLNEVVLSYNLAYSSGAFGKYYLTTLTPLYQAGSQTAGAAGLSQYTTFTSQSKDASNAPVNIGLHYVAATNALPLDSDGDGVPDYVEAEHGTDPNNAMTDGVTNDSYSAAYDDVDLSGNGLVGRIKKALGLNPLNANNPLKGAQIITGQEPDVTTFEVPVDYDTLTNIGQLKLQVDGNVASFQQIDRAPNGNSLLTWNSTFDSPGQHYLQIQFLLNGQYHQGSIPDPTILKGLGLLGVFNSTNICQFDPFYSSFDSSGALLYAKTPTCPNADYTIELQTEMGAHIKTLTGNTATGEISTNWDLTDDNGDVVTNNTIKAVFNVTLQDPGEGSLTFWLHRALYGSEDGNFTVAYTWDVDSEASGAMRDAIQNCIVDPLMAPLESGGTGSENPYPTTFNEYTWSGNLNGNPGYLPNQPAANNLVTNLSDVDTMNFYFDGHGSPSTLGDDSRQQVAIFVTGISSALGNKFTPNQGMQISHPYRFVFLNACDTANDRDWAHAFGILDSISPAQVAIRPLGAQAFLGWIGEPRAADGDDEWNDEGETFAVFFESWQAGYDLTQCIQLASSTHPFGEDGPTLNFPLGKKFSHPYNLLHPGQSMANNFSLKIYGYPWIRREGYNTP